MGKGECEPPLVAREGHALPKESLSPVGDVGAAEICRNSWWEKRLWKRGPYELIF